MRTVQVTSFQWHGWLLLGTEFINTCAVSTLIYSVMLSVIAYCVSPFLLVFSLLFSFQPQIVHNACFSDGLSLTVLITEFALNKKKCSL